MKIILRPRHTDTTRFTEISIRVTLSNIEANRSRGSRVVIGKTNKQKNYNYRFLYDEIFLDDFKSSFFTKIYTWNINLIN